MLYIIMVTTKNMIMMIITESPQDTPPLQIQDHRRTQSSQSCWSRRMCPCNCGSRSNTGNDDVIVIVIEIDILAFLFRYIANCRRVHLINIIADIEDRVELKSFRTFVLVLVPWAFILETKTLVVSKTKTKTKVFSKNKTLMVSKNLSKTKTKT